MKNLRHLVLALLFLPLSCIDAGEPPEGILPAHDDSGPTVVWDLDAEPLPEIPFPNDVATRLDPTSPTGRRVNISLDTDTRFERDLREKADTLTGFGVFSNLTVTFDAPIDLCNLAARHHNDTTKDDDAIYLVDVTAGDHFGELIEMDMGRGFFPMQLESRNYFAGDLGGENMLLAEDVPYPPTCADASVSFEYDKNTWYEHETNTIIMRPMDTLRERHTYAVVLTRRLIGEDGAPVSSPFPWINHSRQTPALEHLEEALAPLNTDLDDVAFAWTFTVQDATSELHAIRRGMYGHGPFKALAETFPIDAETVTLFDLFDDETALPDNPYVLPVSTLVETLRPFFGMLLDSEGAADPLIDTYKYADYLVTGVVRAPNFLVDRDGVARDPVGCDAEPGSDDFDCRLGISGDDDEVFDVDMNTGRMTVGEGKVSFWCVIPNQDRRSRPGPFPVAFYGHGYTSSRLEMLGFAGNHARHGVATCAVDSFGHGLGFSPSELPMSLIRGVFASGGMGPMVDSMVPGRARDINNDGVPDSGGDFWVADAFHTRDIVRQSIVDWMSVIRFLRSCDGRLGHDMNGDGTPEKMCDFDGDGRVDLGGPDNSYFAWGQSLGGILGGIIAGVEPSLAAAAPTAGVAGLFDVAVRSKQGGVKEAVWLPLMGPLFYGEPSRDGSKTEVSTIVSDFNKDAKLLLGAMEPLSEGDEVVVENLRSGKAGRTLVRADGTFRTQIGADAINASEKRACLDFEVMHWENPLFGTEPPLAITDTEYSCGDIPLGDRLRVSACVGACGDDLSAAEKRWVLDTFEGEVDDGQTAGGEMVRGVYFQGTVYAKGSPLIAVSQGFGYPRQTPDLRRLRGLAGFIVEAGDPAAYSRFYLRDAAEWEARWGEEGKAAEPGLEFGTPTNVVVTLGDMNVPVSGGVMNAYLAGYLNFEQLTFLRDNYVLEAVEDVRADVWGAPVLFDPDNLSQGTDGFQVDGVPAPHPPAGEELRATVTDTRGKKHALRMPAILPSGDHGFLVPDPALPFDVHSFMAHQISHYFATDGAELSDELCLHDQTCDWIR
ncbi:MAG: hypothetical protein P1V51_23510 [Deltaproteobacteria bacterium]|nr:hypothetical protein [Deltaproteobacteria bacterium]